MLLVVYLKRTLFIALFAAAFLVSCEREKSLNPGGSENVIAFPALSSSDNLLQNPYPAPSEDLAQYYGTPPPAVLTTGEQAQTAALGSYCWIQEPDEGSNAEACLDSPGITTPQLFLAGEVQFMGRLRLPIPIPPASLSIYSMPVTPADVMQPPSDATILWSYLEGQTVTLVNEIEQELKLELQPGLNVLYVDARWEGLGSVGYGFLVDAVAP